MNRKLRLIIALATVQGYMVLFALDSAAQVKIGNNPQAIDPASNLEVEATTAGRKISVDKTTGKLTIKDGSQGKSKILTSDENGVAEWKETGIQTVDVSFRTRKKETLVSPGGNFDYAPYTIPADFNKGAHFNNSTGRFKAPRAGYYMFNAGIRVELPNTGTRFRLNAFIVTSLGQLRGIVAEDNLGSGKYSYNLSSIFQIEANEEVWVQFQSTDPGFSVISGFFEGIAIGAM